MPTKRYLTAQEAATELGISLTTLYAYVSRGLIRSEETEEKRRTRRYSQEDVLKLKTRKEYRRDPSKATQKALDWGTPILDSALTLIANGRCYYRGKDVLELAVSRTVEEVAALLWTGDLASASSLFEGQRETAFPENHAVYGLFKGMSSFVQFQTLLPIMAQEDYAAYDLRPASVVQTGVRILHLLTRIATGTTVGEGIAAILQRAWVPNNPLSTDLFRTALILCADHELNVSAFTARCVASAGSSPYAVVGAGLAALQGVKHGGHTERVEALFREAQTALHPSEVISNRLRRGEHLPGFGHPLYPEGDPRGRLLLDITKAAFPTSQSVLLATALEEATVPLLQQHPTLDFGLVTLSQALELPSGTALTLFALGRTIGWIGHALETYQSNQLIRPRARYTGEPPRK